MTEIPITPERLAEVRQRFDAIPNAEPDSLTGHVKGLLALIDALSASPAPASGGVDAVAWQDISTAPKDGTWFIAAQDGETFPCEWHVEEDGEGGRQEGWFDHFNQSFEAPTLWHPAASLSPAPTSGSEAGGDWRGKLIERLMRCAEDPMWADHAEVSKSLLLMAIAAIKDGAKPASSPAGGAVGELTPQDIRFLTLAEVYDGAKMNDFVLSAESWKKAEQLGLVECTGSYKWRPLVDIATYIAALSPSTSAAAPEAPAQSGVRVKPLEWNEYEHEGSADRWDAAAGSFHVYYGIELHHDGYRAFWDGEALGPFGSLDEAKAAAQADYEFRIRPSVASDATPPAPATEGRS